MVRLASALLFLLIAVFPAAGGSPLFPRGTAVFFRTYAQDAVPAEGGGVWVALPGGIAHYTAAGQGSVLATPGGMPYFLALAADGSIWYANPTGLARISTSGALLEQHAMSGITDLTVADDGAVWYLRAHGSIAGRVAAGTASEFTAPAQAWSLAPAGDGAVWILGTGFGTEPDVLHRMSAAGDVTTYPLGADVLFGRLQVVADGTLYIGTGYGYSLLRLRRGSTTVEVVPGVQHGRFFVDDAHNLWLTSSFRLTYLGADGTRFTIDLPRDPRTDCVNIPAWAYRPLAIDSERGLWLRVLDEAAYFPMPIPCHLPEPPEMPTLIRVDAAGLVSAYGAREIPSLSPAMLLSLAAIVVALGVLRART